MRCHGYVPERGARPPGRSGPQPCPGPVPDGGWRCPLSATLQSGGLERTLNQDPKTALPHGRSHVGGSGSQPQKQKPASGAAAQGLGHGVGAPWSSSPSRRLHRGLQRGLQRGLLGLGWRTDSEGQLFELRSPPHFDGRLRSLFSDLELQPAAVSLAFTPGSSRGPMTQHFLTGLAPPDASKARPAFTASAPQRPGLYRNLLPAGWPCGLSCLRPLVLGCSLRTEPSPGRPQRHPTGAGRGSRVPVVPRVSTPHVRLRGPGRGWGH